MKKRLQGKEEFRMEDKIRLGFLSQINQMAEEMIQERFHMIELDFEKVLPAIVKELADQISPVMEQYKAQQEGEENGSLRWVYLSFLRSSVLDGAPCYRIDFYDERDQISEQECAGGWDFEYMFQHLKDIYHQLQIEFSQQSRVKMYELDAVVYYLAERFQKEAEKLIPEIVRSFMEEYGTDFFGEEPIKFRLGELFDKSELIAEWKPAGQEMDEGEAET